MKNTWYLLVNIKGILSKLVWHDKKINVIRIAPWLKCAILQRSPRAYFLSITLIQSSHWRILFWVGNKCLYVHDPKFTIYSLGINPKNLCDKSVSLPSLKTAKAVIPLLASTGQIRKSTKSWCCFLFVYLRLHRLLFATAYISADPTTK